MACTGHHTSAIRSGTKGSSCSCGFPLRFIANLRRHVNTVHRGSRVLWICPTCGKEATTWRQLTDHARHSHSLRENDLTVQVQICDDYREVVEIGELQSNILPVEIAQGSF